MASLLNLTIVPIVPQSIFHYPPALVEPATFAMHWLMCSVLLSTPLMFATVIMFLENKTSCGFDVVFSDLLSVFHPRYWRGFDSDNLRTWPLYFLFGFMFCNIGYSLYLDYQIFAFMEYLEAVMVALIPVLPDPIRAGFVVFEFFTFNFPFFFVSIIVWISSRLVAVRNLVSFVGTLDSPPIDHWLFLPLNDLIRSLFNSQILFAVLSICAHLIVPWSGLVIASISSPYSLMVYMTYAMSNILIHIGPFRYLLVYYLHLFVRSNVRIRANMVPLSLVFALAGAYETAAVLLLSEVPDLYNSFMIFHPWWWLFSKTWFPLAKQQFQFVFGLAGLWFFRWPLLSLAITWPFLVAIALINVYYCRYYRGAIRISYPDYVRSVGEGAIRAVTNPRWFTAAEIRDIYPIKDGDYYWWPHQRFNSWGKGEAEHADTGIEHHDEESSVSNFAEYAVPGWAGWRDSRFKFETGRPHMMECNSLSSRFVRPRRLGTVTLEHQDFGDFKEAFLSTIPNLRTFVEQHPVASVVLTSTWMTRSYYACQHVLGFVATIVELAILFSLSIDQKVVEGCANMFMNSVSNPRLNPKFDPILEHQDDGPTAAYQIANGAVELASAAIGLGSSADFHKRLVVSQLAANRFKDVVGFITFAMKLIKAIHHFCKWYVFGPSRSDRIGLLVQQFAVSSGQFALVDMQRMDQYKAKELIELYETGIGLRAHAMQWPEDIRKEYLHPLDRVLSEAKLIYDQLLDIVRYSSPRPEPAVMTFQGNPAVMKSCLTSLLAKAAILHLNGGVYDPSLKYPLNPVLKHFDGYRPNALVVVNDDYHQFKDAESLVSASQFMIRAVNHEEFILPMANVNLKGLKFRARAILLSTNVDIMKLYGKGQEIGTLEHAGANATVPVSSTNAYGRRHQNVYTVEIKDEGRAKILAARSADDLSLADIESAYRIRHVGMEVRKGNDAYLGGVPNKPVVSVESLVLKLIQEIDERQARKDGIDAALLKVADSIVSKNSKGDVQEDALEKMERFMSTQSFSDKVRSLKDFDIGALISRLGKKVEMEANSVIDLIRPINPEFSFAEPSAPDPAAGVLHDDEGSAPMLEHQSRTRRYDEIDPRVLTKKQRRRLRAAKRHNARKRATEQVRVPKFMNNPLYQNLEHQAGPLDSFMSDEALAEQYVFIIENWNVFTEDLDGWYYSRLLDFAELCRNSYVLTRGFDPYPEFWEVDLAEAPDWHDSDETDEETAEQRWFDMQDAIERGDYDLEHQMWSGIRIERKKKPWFGRIRIFKFIKNMFYPILAPFFHAVGGFFHGLVVSVSLVKGLYRLVMSDKIRKKAIILSVSAVVVLLLVLLGFLIFKSPNTEHQSVDKRRVEPKKPKPIQLTARNIQEFSRPNMEHQAVKFDQNLSEMLLTNITTAFGVITINGQYASRSHIQCIGHGLAIVAAHAWHRVEETQCTVSIYLPKKTKVFEYGEIRPMYTDPDADIMIIYHPYFLVKAMDKYYLDLDEIVSCVQNGTPAFMLKMSSLADKGVPTEVPISNLRFANRYLSGPILDYGIPFIEGDTPTEPGDCISLLFFRDPTLKSGRFAGFLFGGSVKKGEGQTCYFCPFSKQDCQAVFSGFMENQTDEFRGCEEVPRKKRLGLDQIPDGVRFHGYTRHPVHASTKQGIVESEIAEDLLEEGFVPRTAPTTCTEDMKGFEYGLSKWSRPKPHVTLSWVKETLGDVWQEWPAPYQKEILSFDEAIKGKGDIYMDPIRQASGPGYSYVSKGGKFPWLFVDGDDRKASEMLRERISDTISAAASQSGFSPAAEYQKNERVSKPKYSNRMISAGQIDAQIVMRSLFAPWLDSRRRMCPTGPSMVGFNPWSIHWHIMELKGAHKNIIAGDISGYDISVLSTLIMFWGEQVLKWFSAHVNDGLNWLRFWYILHTVVWHLHAVLYYWFGRDGVNSGNIITVEINDAINMMITQIAAITILKDEYSRDEVLEMFRDGTINCFFYGDDSRIYVADRISEKFNNITYAETLRNLFGMTVTPSHDKNAPLSKWPSPEETVFLRRRTVRLGGLRFGAFSIPECYEIAYWCSTKGDKKTMTRDNCEAALRELGFHGPDVYQKAWNTFSRGLAKHKCPPLRVNYNQWWVSVFGAVPSGQYEIHVSQTITAESDLPRFVQSSPPKPGVLLREEEEGPQALERGVRLLQNKGFPVDVQLVLARLSEKQTCYCLPSKVKEQPKLFSLTSRALTQFCTPMSEFEKFTDLMARSLNHKTYGELHKLQHQSELREPQDNPISTPQQTQTVVDQIKDTYQQFGLPPSYYQLCDMDPLPDHGQKEVLSRPYEVYNATWQASAPAGTLMKELGFPGALFAIPQIVEKLRWFTYFRCKGIKLTVRLNLTPFHFGCLMLSNVEGQSSYGAAVHDATFAQRLNNRPIFLTAMGSPPVEVFYPWTLPMQWLPWKLIDASTFTSAPGNASLTDIIQRVCLDVVQPLQTLGAGNTAGSITIFANFVDPEVQGPCLSTEPYPVPPQLEHQSEEVKKVEDGVFTAIGSVENSVKSVMEIVESVGNVSAFASSFDKPMLKTIEQKIVFDNQTDSSYVRGGVVGQKLTATPEATLADHGMMNGNLTIKNIIETPGAIDLFAIEGGTHVAGDLVESWTVHPCFSRNTTTWGTGTAVVPTYYGYVASLFKWWRGGINYQFRFFCPKFATMRGRFVWFPPDCGVASRPPSTLSAADTGNLYSQVFDITGDTIVSILIPWLSPLVYRQVQPTIPGSETADISLGNVPGGALTYPTMGNSNGTLALYMVNDISAPASDTPINITAVVYASADFDTQLGFFAGVDQTLNLDWGFREPPAPNLEHQSGSVWGNAVSHEYVAPAPDSQTRAKKPVPIATKKASNTLDAAATAIVGRLDRNFVMPEDLTGMALVDLLKRFVYPSGLNFWNAYMSPLGFNGLYQYISLLFIWARGSFVIRFTDDSTPANAFVAQDDQNRSDGVPHTQGIQNHVMKTVQIYPQVPFPYWPVGVNLIQPTPSVIDNTCQYWGPLTWTWPGGSANWIANINAANGGFCGSVGDDFGLFQMYSPPLIVVPAADDVVINAASDKVPRSPDLSQSTPPPAPRRPLSGSDENLEGLSSPTRSVKRVGGSWRIFSKK